MHIYIHTHTQTYTHTYIKTYIHNRVLTFSAVFFAKSDVGIGTIVGSAMFNTIVIIALSGLFAGMVSVLPQLFSSIICVPRITALISN